MGGERGSHDAARDARLPDVKIQKLSGTNAFVAVDLDGAPSATGVVRCAPKVLQGGAQAMARTTTYTFAIRGLQIGGASAGISAEGDQRDDAIATFVAELAPRAESGELILDAGRGVEPAQLEGLAVHDPRPPVHREDLDGRPLAASLHARGVVAAATAVLGSLAGRTAIVEAGPDHDDIVAALAAVGLTTVGTDLAATADVVFCGSRQGVVDGVLAATLAAGLVVPTGPHAISAKGLAVLSSRDVIALPDFVTLAGPTFAGWPEGEATVDAITATAEAWIAATITEAVAHDEGPILGACYRAEEFLRTWRDELPFGRPLA